MTSFSKLVGRQLKLLRFEKNMTQQELCDGICSQAVISKIEHGKISTTIELLQELAKRLNVPISRLFDRDAESISFQKYDRELTHLFRTHQFDELISRSKKLIELNENKDIVLLAKYFDLVALEGKKNIDYRTCISELSYLTEQEAIWYESPFMYLRIKMAIANYYYLNQQFVHSKKVYVQLLEMDFNTTELKKLRIKILYNHAQQLFFQGDYKEGKLVTERGINESVQLFDTSFLGHFYYQKANFDERLENDVAQIEYDYTMSYTLFSAVELSNYVKIVEDGRKHFLLFTF